MLSDVFALQEHMRRAIAEISDIVLHAARRDNAWPLSTTNAEAYALYMQATGTSTSRRRTFADRHRAARAGDQARSENTHARARLATIEAIASTYMVVADVPAMVASAEEHARIASELDPTLAEPYGALGQSLRSAAASPNRAPHSSARRSSIRTTRHRRSGSRPN